MPGIQTFRTALGGFNRQDVVQYIEFINNQHNTQIEQLNTQLQNARDALAKATAIPSDQAALVAQLEAAQARCAELEAQLAGATTPTDNELEAYRRAERAERMAQERAAQIYNQANAVLADATVKVESVSANMESIAQQITQQLQTSKETLQAAVTDMYAIRPEEK